MFFSYGKNKYGNVCFDFRSLKLKNIFLYQNPSVTIDERSRFLLLHCKICYILILYEKIEPGDGIGNWLLLLKLTRLDSADTVVTATEIRTATLRVNIFSPLRICQRHTIQKNAKNLCQLKILISHQQCS